MSKHEAEGEVEVRVLYYCNPRSGKGYSKRPASYEVIEDTGTYVTIRKTREAWERNNPHRSFPSAGLDTIERRVSKVYFEQMYE